MRIWKIIPVATERDPHWQDRRIWREVIVRAETASLARLLAAKLDQDGDSAGMGNETPGTRSGFDDEKLYWVTELDTGAVSPADLNGPPGVLRAEPLPPRAPQG